MYLDDWGSEWQGTYTFARSVPQPSGTRIDVEAVYDHSPGNRRNPSAPPGDVNRGEGTSDETCIASVRVTADAEQLGYRPLTRGHLSEDTCRRRPVVKIDVRRSADEARFRPVLRALGSAAGYPVLA